MGTLCWMRATTLSYRKQKPPEHLRRTTAELEVAINEGCAGVANPNLELDHVEVALRRAAFRPNQVVWNVGPSGARRQALVRRAGLFVIDVTARPALPGFIGFVAHLDSRSCSAGGGWCRECRGRIFERLEATPRQPPSFITAARQLCCRHRRWSRRRWS